LRNKLGPSTVTPHTLVITVPPVLRRFTSSNGNFILLDKFSLHLWWRMARCFLEATTITFTRWIWPLFPRPGRLWLMTQFAERFGGDPEDYSRCFYAMFLLAHGAASLLSLSGDDIAREEVRRNFLEISTAPIKQNEIFQF
jgi:hypothetical protein